MQDIAERPGVGMDRPESVQVRVEGSDVEFAADLGESIMAAAQRAGYRWPTVCEGHGDCLACRITVVSGADRLSDVTPAEVKRLAQLNKNRPADEWFRLACQAKVLGDVVVHKRNVK